MRIKELRQRIGKTQEEVAIDLKLKKQTYQNYELEKREPDIKTLLQIADYYKVSLDELFNRSLNKTIELLPYQNEIYKELPKLNETQCSAIMSMIKAFNIPTTEEDLINARLIKKYGDK